MKIAAIQMDVKFADVQANIINAEKHVKQAVLAGAELVLLPEFFTSGMGFSPKMLDAATASGKVNALLKQWAAEQKIIIGGSYIVFDGKNAYNLFALVFPNGEAFEHKKDIPTQFENCYYTNGDKNNVLYTPIGNIGVALCWEMIRYDTLKRLSGNVDIVLAGSCWWDLPKDAPVEREALRQYNQKLALDTPVTLAKLLGVPVVHANHCGEAASLDFPNANKTQIRRFIGAAQIIDGNGNILARKPFYEGEDIVMQNISWDVNDRVKTAEYPSAFWIPDLHDSYINAWESLNSKGEEYYRATALPHYKSHCKGRIIWPQY